MKQKIVEFQKIALYCIAQASLAAFYLKIILHFTSKFYSLRQDIYNVIQKLFICKFYSILQINFTVQVYIHHFIEKIKVFKKVLQHFIGKLYSIEQVNCIQYYILLLNLFSGKLFNILFIIGKSYGNFHVNCPTFYSLLVNLTAIFM